MMYFDRIWVNIFIKCVSCLYRCAIFFSSLLILIRSWNHHKRGRWPVAVHYIVLRRDASFWILNSEHGRGAIFFSTRSSCALRPIEFKIMMRYANDRTLQAKKNSEKLWHRSQGRYLPTIIYTLHRNLSQARGLQQCLLLLSYTTVPKRIT